jgi:hypothetical protein
MNTSSAKSTGTIVKTIALRHSEPELTGSKNSRPHMPPQAMLQ